MQTSTSTSTNKNIEIYIKEQPNIKRCNLLQNFEFNRVKKSLVLILCFGILCFTFVTIQKYLSESHDVSVKTNQFGKLRAMSSYLISTTIVSLIPCLQHLNITNEHILLLSKLNQHYEDCIKLDGSLISTSKAYQEMISSHSKFVESLYLYQNKMVNNTDYIITNYNLYTDDVENFISGVNKFILDMLSKQQRNMFWYVIVICGMFGLFTIILYVSRIQTNKLALELKLSMKIMPQLCHELKGGISIIMVYFEELFEVLPQSSIQISTSNPDDKGVSAYNATRSLHNILTNRLLMTKIMLKQYQPQLETVDILSILSTITDHYKHLVSIHSNKYIEVLMITTVPILWVMVDIYLVERIIHNLLSNAVKNTTEGSITVKFDHDNVFMTIKIIDTGVGIEEDLLKKLFGSTGHMNVDKRGTGLGLSFVKTVVDLIKGDVYVEETQLDIGTTFVVKIPIIIVNNDNRTTSNKNVSYNPNVKPLNSYCNKIVVIADDQIVIKTIIENRLKSLTNELQWTFVFASTGEEVISIHKHSHFDILVIDENMHSEGGHISGSKTVKSLRKSQFNGVAISCSGNEIESSFRKHYDIIWGKPLPTKLQMTNDLELALHKKS